MPQQPRKKESLQTHSNSQKNEEEYTDERRRTNEVASTACTGSVRKKVDLQHDRLETGGF